jgi:hypothetical protein
MSVSQIPRMSFTKGMLRITPFNHTAACFAKSNSGNPESNFLKGVLRLTPLILAVITSRNMKSSLVCIQEYGALEQPFKSALTPPILDEQPQVMPIIALALCRQL